MTTRTTMIDANDPLIGFLSASDCCQHILERYEDHDVLFRKPLTSHPRDNYLDVVLAVNRKWSHLQFIVRMRNHDTGSSTAKYIDCWPGEDPVRTFLDACTEFDNYGKVPTAFRVICAARMGIAEAQRQFNEEKATAAASK